MSDGAASIPDKVMRRLFVIGEAEGWLRFLYSTKMHGKDAVYHYQWRHGKRWLPAAFTRDEILEGLGLVEDQLNWYAPR